MESQIETRSRTPDLPSHDERRRLTSGMAIVVAIAVAKLLFHVYFNKGYGYFRDEFDYMACGDHLAWGYVDHPPLMPFLTHTFRAVLGDSLRSIRFLPAVASSLLVVQAALIAREFGGKRFWLWFGVIAGLGLEEKYSIAVFGLAVAVGLVLTDARRVLRSQWIWLGALAAFLIFLPNLLWNVHRHWPFLELMHNIRAEGRDVIVPAGQYFLQQTMLVHPLTAPIWITGLIALFLWPPLKPHRLLAWSYVISYAIFFALHGKIYYLSPIYSMLLASGAVVIESSLEGAGHSGLKAAIIAVLVAGGLYIAPVAVPILPPGAFIAYTRYLPMKLPV